LFNLSSKVSRIAEFEVFTAVTWNAIISSLTLTQALTACAPEQRSSTVLLVELGLLRGDIFENKNFH
jgi:hypothetical protein